MVSIIFEAHGTSLDNEKGLSSGHFDVALSKLGEKQAKQLGERHENEKFDAIFCSDLKRSYNTAEIAFADRNFQIIKDKRLREVDYGKLTRHKEKETKPLRGEFVAKSWPTGQSYQETTELIKSLLLEILEKYNDKQIMIIGHRSVQYALEHFVHDIPLHEAVTAAWQWQSGWRYELTGPSLSSRTPIRDPEL